jgi:cytochrome c-type biogenesis protein CcmE
MSALDKELSQAVEESEGSAPATAAPVVAPGVPRGSSSRKKSLGLLLALLVIGGALFSLVMTSFEGEAIYSKGVDELLSGSAQIGERTVRVQGILVKGSLKRRDQPCEYRFRMKKNDAEVEVRYPQCVVPDTFRDVPNMDVEVTATGKMAGEHFQASHIMAKCPSKYDMKQRAAAGEEAPHALGPTAPAEQTY